MVDQPATGQYLRTTVHWTGSLRLLHTSVIEPLEQEESLV